MKKPLLFILLVNLALTAFSQTTYVVNSPADLPDINLNDSVCIDAQGNCTLRAAIQNANKTTNKDIIHFNISGNAPFVITVTDVMEPIQQPVIIDGRTQLDYINSPIIEIDGSNLAGNHNGLQLIGDSDGSEIYGLSIGGFKRLEVYPYNYGDGIFANTGNHIIQSNYIGIKPDGTTINANTGHGMYFNNTGGNSIGGTQPNQGNLISGNGVGGITFEGSTTNSAASNNIVQGNLIGTDVTGTLNKGNKYNVQFLNAPNNILGGNSSAARNIISGANSAQNEEIGTGIAISGPESYNNQVIGNYIGTDITGTQAIPNVRGGVFVLFGASNNTIGSDNIGEGNLISGNGFYGVYFQGNTANNPVAYNNIKGNYIGVDVTGNVSMPNGYGIMMLSGENMNNSIGGTTPNSRNIISGNIYAGIAIISGDNTQILGNYIGTNALGTVAIPNSTGVDVRDGNNTIGGSTPTARNIISGNIDGIQISNAESNGSSVKGNYIGLNAEGTAAIPNQTGIILISSTTNITIGGTDPLDRNIISGNSTRGLYVTGTSITIQNNYIGLSSDGTNIINNEVEGIRFNGALTGTEVSKNVISGNGNNPTNAKNVLFDSASNVHFFDNKVGTLPDGNTGVLNIGSGLFLYNSSDNIIGGALEDEGNIIGSHNLNGISVALNSSNNLFIYNSIGVGSDGSSEIGNNLNGIGISGANTGNEVINNIIANNLNGLQLSPTSGTPTQVTISENSIYNNSNIGIDLMGATENDVDDADSGPNNLQNTPEISAIVNLGNDVLEVTYSVPSSISNSAYPMVIEFFGAANGQGKFFIEADTYVEPGNKTVTLNLSAGYNLDDYLTIVATATDANGNTSEFGISTNSTLSVAQLANDTFKIYPNPISDTLFIQSPVSENYVLELVNTLGQVVLKQNSNKSSLELNVSNLTKGLYFLNITSDEGGNQTIKLIKN